MTIKTSRNITRDKRFAHLNAGVWDFGIVPYVFEVKILDGEWFDFFTMKVLFMEVERVVTYIKDIILQIKTN
jgi:hypothetical protein